MNKNDSNKDSNIIKLSKIDILINKICNDINNKIRKNKLKKLNQQ